MVGAEPHSVSWANPGRRPRQSPRIALEAEVGLRRTSKLSCTVSIHDISRHGCRLEFIERPQVDEHVWVRLDGLEPLRAYVCWVRGFEAGVRFAAAIHPGVFDLLLGRLR